mmetsp:Transcript_9950/g.20257  ORF Transcript_9950/g.20257 Transcript_9950/m.20257 type:complete len:251 (-) Transcript_9950:1730-2482(-)
MGRPAGRAASSISTLTAPSAPRSMKASPAEPPIMFTMGPLPSTPPLPLPLLVPPLLLAVPTGSAGGGSSSATKHPRAWRRSSAVALSGKPRTSTAVELSQLHVGWAARRAMMAAGVARQPIGANGVTVISSCRRKSRQSSSVVLARACGGSSLAAAIPMASLTLACTSAVECTMPVPTSRMISPRRLTPPIAASPGLWPNARRADRLSRAGIEEESALASSRVFLMGAKASLRAWARCAGSSVIMASCEG